MLTDQQPVATAVITGASSGLGRVFAIRLAQRGHALLLIGRDPETLRSVLDECEVYGVAAEAITADLASDSEIERVAARIRSLPRIDFLVNNAGFGTMGDFHQLDPNVHAEMLRVHCLATIQLTHAALTRMYPADHGSIINVSSLSAFLIAPGQVTYSATKAMLVRFTESLQAELKSTKIRVQVLCPGYTKTGFHDRPAFAEFNRSQVSQGLWMTAEEVVEHSLKSLGGNRVICVPGFKNRLIATLLRFKVFQRILGSKVRKRPQVET